jgi:Replication-relaxation
MAMKSNLSTKAPAKGVLLNSTDEKIISMMYTFRFAGALDTAHYLFSPTSLTYARSRLSSLAAAKYLYRFRLPSTKTGGAELIYTLGSRGRDFVAKKLGLPIDFYFRPSHMKHLSYSQAQHNLLLTRFCVATASFCRRQTHLRLVQTRLCYELSRETAQVIPDAWLCFDRLRNGSHESFIPVLLEIDRGMEYQLKLKQHVRSRIEFIRSGAYRKLFETDAVLIAYVTTGDLPEYRETRRKAMCTWIKEVLSDLKMEDWSQIFRITSVVYEELYDSALFDEPVWHRPDSPTPVPLFAP